MWANAFDPVQLCFSGGVDVYTGMGCGCTQECGKKGCAPQRDQVP
jgi:hypothetical protein